MCARKILLVFLKTSIFISIIRRVFFSSASSSSFSSFSLDRTSHRCSTSIFTPPILPLCFERTYYKIYLSKNFRPHLINRECHRSRRCPKSMARRWDRRGRPAHREVGNRPRPRLPETITVKEAHTAKKTCTRHKNRGVRFCEAEIVAMKCKKAKVNRQRVLRDERGKNWSSLPSPSREAGPQRCKKNRRECSFSPLLLRGEKTRPLHRTIITISVLSR